MGNVTDPAQLADAQGYAWFWALLGTVAAVMGVVSFRFDVEAEEAAR
jgi:hypothetical protein